MLYNFYNFAHWAENIIDWMETDESENGEPKHIPQSFLKNLLKN